MDILSFKRQKRANCSLHNNLLSAVSTPRLTEQIPNIFTKEVSPVVGSTNQKSTGRCWIFAALNMVRRSVIKEYNLSENFEFSQSHLFFYDKLERMNYNIRMIENFKSKQVNFDDRIVQHLLKEPFGDGGQWVMFTNIANKYGLVPKDSYPESTHSSNSRGINMVLNRLFRTYAKDIYTDNNFNKSKAMQKTYDILVKFFGEPPQNFCWHYKKDNEMKSFTGTPLQFFKDFCHIDFNDYVSLTHDPRNTLNELYGVEHLGNVENGDSVKYLNLDINRLKELTKKSIDKNIPIWFGSDVGQFFNSSLGVLDEASFDYINFLKINDTLNKKERIDYCESLMTHAMVYVGYHEDQYGSIDYWKIENSWGPEGPYKGSLVCSDKWFKDYTYQLIVPKKFLTKKELVLWNSDNVTNLPLWDPMGSLA
jgi:bleomycin hydrolase